jgi:hypothetical protein
VLKPRLLLGIVLLEIPAACAPRALSLAPGHPARADAPTAPISEPSPTLRPGVAGDVLAEPDRPEAGATMGGHGGHGSHEEAP